MDHLVLDIEIQREIGGPRGLTWDDTDRLGVSVAVVYEMEEDRYTVYGHDDVDALKRRLLVADRITTFNGWRFDLPVIWGLPARHRVVELFFKSDDLLRRIWQGLGLNPDIFTVRGHGGWGLDAVCLATIGRGKTGNGALAPILYQQGRWVELINYCMEDVRLTRDLCREIERTGAAYGPKGQVNLWPWTPTEERLYASPQNDYTA